MKAAFNSWEQTENVTGNVTQSFALTARVSQMPPPGDWRGWLVLGGRGAGKTRTGAEWIRFAANHGGCRAIALVGPTLHDVREIMIDGVSGLRRICRPGETPPVYEASRRRLVWPNGAVAQAFSAEDAESLRGPQFDAAWCDEAGAWRHGRDVWDMLQLGLRLGQNPRAVVTTTPRRTPLLRHLMSDAGIIVTRSPTVDNAGHLSPAFLAHIESSLGGTKLGRQELDGEFLDQDDGVLWTRAMLGQARADGIPSRLDDIVVAVDPPVSIGEGADACGIVAAGVGQAASGRSHFWVLADMTVQGVSPARWAEAAVNLADRVGASRVIAEANQGGELVRSVLTAAGCDQSVQLVHARLSKTARAAPVLALYEQGRVSHAAAFPGLEEQMLSFGGTQMPGSPDRVDALVWAVSALNAQIGRTPRIQRL